MRFIEASGASGCRRLRRISIYRIEEKFRLLQKQKRGLTEDVLGEEKFAQSLTLDDLHFLFCGVTRTCLPRAKVRFAPIASRHDMVIGDRHIRSSRCAAWFPSRGIGCELSRFAD